MRATPSFGSWIGSAWNGLCVYARVSNKKAIERYMDATILACRDMPPHDPPSLKDLAWDILTAPLDEKLLQSAWDGVTVRYVVQNEPTCDKFCLWVHFFSENHSPLHFIIDGSPLYVSDLKAMGLGKEILEVKELFARKIANGSSHSPALGQPGRV